MKSLAIVGDLFLVVAHGAGSEPARERGSGVARGTLRLALGAAAALAAGAALGDDPTSRLLLERAQREDAFTLGVQQSLQNARAGNLGPRERLELDTRQRDQREAQDALFDRQSIRTYAPATGIQRRTETMRAAQERQEQLSRFRFDAASPPASKPAAPAPAPIVSPTIVTSPVPRAPAGPAALPSVAPAHPEALAKIRRLEHEAGTLWGAALAGDWDAAQGVLGDLRRSVAALRSDAFKAEYTESGGRIDTLVAVLDRLRSAISGAEIEIGARDATAVMHRANALMLTAAELVPDIARPVAGQAIGRK